MNIWIEQEEPSAAESLAEAISNTIQVAIHLGPDAIEKGVPWAGPHLVSKLMLAVSPQPEDQLSSKTLKYHSEKGRNVFDVIAMIAIQLGIEQGLKIYEEDYLEAEVLIRSAKFQKEKENNND